MLDTSALGCQFLSERQLRFEDTSRVIELPTPFRNAESRPILRGLRLSDYDVRLDVFDNCTIDLWLLFEIGTLALEGILGAMLLVLHIAEWFRRLAEVPEWEYVLELEIADRGPAEFFSIQTFDDDPSRPTYFRENDDFPEAYSASASRRRTAAQYAATRYL